MAYGELYVYVNDTTGWKQANQMFVYVNDTLGWKEANEAYVYVNDTTGWKQFWPTAFPALVSVGQNISSDGSGCAPDKCLRCVEWEAENCSDTNQHIRLARSVSGGNFLETFDDVAINRRCNATPAASDCGDSGCNSGTTVDLLGCFCDAGCQGDGTSTAFQVRLENDGGDTLAGPVDCEKTTETLSICGQES